MRTPARPRLPDGDCVFISGVRIAACANVPIANPQPARQLMGKPPEATHFSY